MLSGRRSGELPSAVADERERRGDEPAGPREPTEPALGAGDRVNREQAILAALPPLARTARFYEAVASVLVEHEGRVLDGGVLLGETEEVFVRPLPQHDHDGLDTWIAVLERRRSQLAHDVSGPAMGVLAALETVLEYEPIADTSRTLLEDARAGILRLTSLLADRSSALSGPANVVAGPLERLIARVADPIAASLDPLGGRLECRLRASSADARLDTAVLEGALATLLANAWRHRRGQRVQVRIDASIDGGVLVLAVSDDGRGLDAQALRRAGELGFTTRASGVGIGLFLLRRAVSARGGAVLLEALTQGTRASVLLPLNDPSSRRQVSPV